jgi:DNA-binding GntR family transcriptional regulator
MSSTVEASLHYRSLPDLVADHVVVMIAKGELQAGQRLFEKEICASVGVSRIPVREALRLLQAQGVVHTEPNKGTFIAHFGSKEMGELLEIRLGVERIALRSLLASLKSSPSLIDQFVECMNDLRRAALLKDKLAYCQADVAFHTKIIDLSESPILKPVWQSLSRGVLVFIMQERGEAFNYAESIEDHERLLGLIRARNQKAVHEEIGRHILTSLEARNAAKSDSKVVAVVGSRRRR